MFYVVEVDDTLPLLHLLESRLLLLRASTRQTEALTADNLRCEGHIHDSLSSNYHQSSHHASSTYTYASSSIITTVSLLLLFSQRKGFLAPYRCYGSHSLTIYLAYLVRSRKNKGSTQAITQRRDWSLLHHHQHRNINIPHVDNNSNGVRNRSSQTSWSGLPTSLNGNREVFTIRSIGNIRTKWSSISIRIESSQCGKKSPFQMHASKGWYHTQTTSSYAHLCCKWSANICNVYALKFLRSLREQLTELHSFHLGNIPPKTLQGYSFRVDALERTLLARQQEVG